jgi:poly-D-alanine transfer protein DltD
MEDGIEREQLTIIDKIEKNKHIYIYIPDNSDWEDYIIIKDKLKAIEYSKINKCRVEIFNQTEEGIYKPIYRYYKNGEYFIMES